jgi:hypothetical protein
MVSLATDYVEAKDEAQFVGWMTDYAMIKWPDLDEGKCNEYAATAMQDFLNDNRIEFGDKQYGWSKDAAEIVLNEYY